MEHAFTNLANGLDLTVTQKQEEQLALYFNLLVSWNEKMNLTAITDRAGVYIKHFYDSLTAVKGFDFTKIESLCDVGSGAGFPSIVLKIFFPHLQITIVEALAKRLRFLEELIDELGLEGVQLVHARAEEFADTHRETFDVVTARAVARLPMLAELCIPLLKVGGMFIALKGEQGEAENKEAANALRTLGITTIEIETFHLPEFGDKRSILYCLKGKTTPNKYPRQFSQIKSKPIL